MRKFVSIIPVLLFSKLLFAQTEPANYAQTISRFKQFFNADKPDSIYKQFGPEMRAALTPDAFKTTSIQLKGQLGTLNQTTFVSFATPASTYKAEFQNGTLTLILALNSSNQITGLLLRPYQAPGSATTTATTAASTTVTQPTDPSVSEEPFSIKTMSGKIAGTLALPKNAQGKIPVVIIIPGSGPTDRNGNSPQLGLESNAYSMLAIGLAKNGIACLRYDKRMIGESHSSTKESELHLTDYVEDAMDLINQLKQDDRFSKVVIFGHSEGSLVGMLAAEEAPVQGFISAAGAGEPAEKILTQQMKARPEWQQEAFKRMLDTLKKGKIFNQVDPAIYDIARPSVQPYLMSWCRYDPTRELKKVKTPILIVQGTTDIQVSVDNAEKLKKAKSDAQLVIIQGMNHILKTAPADRTANIATYKDPSLPLNTELVSTVVDFVKKLK